MRTITATLITALAALTLAACGGEASGDGSGSGRASGQDAALDGALQFARCMRGEGIDFPDPKRSGNGLVRIGPGPGAGGGPARNPDNPKMRAAADKCRKHLDVGGGEAPDPAQRAKFQDAFVKFARCMRAEGVNVPDPKPGQGGFSVRAGDPNAPRLDSPKFKAADEKCHHHLGAVDEAVREVRAR